MKRCQVITDIHRTVDEQIKALHNKEFPVWSDCESVWSCVIWFRSLLVVHGGFRCLVTVYWMVNFI